MRFFTIFRRPETPWIGCVIVNMLVVGANFALCSPHADMIPPERAMASAPVSVGEESERLHKALCTRIDENATLLHSWLHTLKGSNPVANDFLKELLRALSLPIQWTKRSCLSSLLEDNSFIILEETVDCQSSTKNLNGEIVWYAMGFRQNPLTREQLETSSDTNSFESFTTEDSEFIARARKKISNETPDFLGFLLHLQGGMFFYRHNFARFIEAKNRENLTDLQFIDGLFPPLGSLNP